MFSPDKTRVALIKKNRPAWQAGKLNGIGGHVEEGETSLETMVREFREETGVETDPASWDFFLTLTDPSGSFAVDFFWSVGDLSKLRTTTDEEVGIYRVSEVNEKNAVPNITWLIPLAQVMRHDIVDHYRIEQVI